MMKTTTPSGTLTSAQIAQYYREGYLVVEGLVPHTTIASVMEAARDVAFTDGGGWTPKIFDPHRPDQDANLHRLLVEPAITQAVEQLFEAPARVYYGMLAIVPPNGGKGLPWHQDNQYDQIVGNALNVFIALDNITADMAMLWVAPGTHLKGVQPSQTNTTTAPGHREAIVEPENGIPLPGLNRGDVCIFDRSTYHRSLRNETDRARYAYAAQYMAEYSRLASTGEKDPIKRPVAELRALWNSPDSIQEAR